ncbi:MAG: hypothetical protein E7139_07640 [Rikenellaceae bacterium]|nr:hypothetical protein [Rikenellaceae bacterium]
MKKCLILGCFVLSALSISAVHAMDNSIEVANHITIESDESYEYLGDWKFYPNTKSSYPTNFSVYQKGDYLYAKLGGKYFRLFPCNKDGFNYYFSSNGRCWYAII